MAQVDYKVFLLDKDGNRLAQLYYSRLAFQKAINGIPNAYFEVLLDSAPLKAANFDPLNNVYHIEIERGGKVYWRGRIDEISPPDRGSALDKIGIHASQRLSDFDRVLVKPSNNRFWSRSFVDKKLGTEIVQVVVQEAIEKANSPVADISIGTIEDPEDLKGNVIKISNNFFANTVLEVIEMCAAVGDADYWLDDEEKKFYFVKKRGRDRDDVVFRLHENEGGNNILTFVPHISYEEMVNSVVVLGAGESFSRALSPQLDAASIRKYGLYEGMRLARQIDTDASAEKYAKKILKKYSKPLIAVSFAPTIGTTPFEGYELGDNVWIDIKWKIWNIKKKVRITSVQISVSQEGAETITFGLEEPKD